MSNYWIMNYVIVHLLKKLLSCHLSLFIIIVTCFNVILWFKLLHIHLFSVWYIQVVNQYNCLDEYLTVADAYIDIILHYSMVNWVLNFLLVIFFYFFYFFSYICNFLNCFSININLLLLLYLYWSMVDNWGVAKSWRDGNACCMSL